MCEFKLGDIVYVHDIGEAKIVAIYGEHYDVVQDRDLYTNIHESKIENLEDDEDDEGFDNEDEDEDDSLDYITSTTSTELQMEAAEVAYQKQLNTKSDVDKAEEMYKKLTGVEASISVQPLVQDYTTLMILGII